MSSNLRPPVAELHGVGQVSDLPVAASLRARLPETKVSLDVSWEPEVPGTGGSAAVALARYGAPRKTHPTFGKPFVDRL